MSEIVPDGWSNATFGAHVDMQFGFAFPSSGMKEENVGCKLLRGTNITVGSTRWGARAMYWPHDDAIDNKYALDNNDVVVSMDGSLVGKNYAQISKDDLPAYLVQRVARFRAGKQISQRFIYYMFAVDTFVKYVDVVKTVTAIPHISPTDFKNYPVLLPPLPEQKKIAAILTSVDNVIEKTQAQIDKLNDLKTGMMQELLTKGIGPDGKPHTQFKDSPVGRIPVGWEVKRLIDLINTMDSGWSPQCEPVPAQPGYWGILKTTAVTWKGFNPQANKALPIELEARPELQVDVGNILITRAGPADRVGVVVHVEAKPPKLMLSDKLIRIEVTENNNSAYLSIWLAGEYSQRLFGQLMSGLAESQTNISQAILKDLLCACPPLKEQIAIGRRTTKLNQVIKTKTTYLDLNKNLKKALMQDLLTGKVRVTPDPE